MADGGDTGVGRSMTVEEAVALALRLQHAGQLRQAEGVYRQILAAVPDHVDALHFAGILAFQLDRPDDAVALMRRALALDPEHADAINNLGNVLKGMGRLDEAAEAYRRVVALRPVHADAHNNLGVVHRLRGDLPAAEAALDRALALDPALVDARFNLGNVLASAGRVDEAVVAYEQTIAQKPQYLEAYKKLGMVLYEAGRVERAEAVFRALVALVPEHPLSLHMIALCSGRQAPTRAPDTYVRGLFDRFAGDFDQHLEALEYRAPQLVAEAVAAGVGPAGRDLHVLDAGCGTGLCGARLRPFARRLTGVDLSGGMLAKARATGHYDDLREQELTAHLEDAPAAYDVIASADTLVYFGDLVPVLIAAARALRPGGLLVFSVEKSEEPTGFAMHLQSRYCHSPAYVRGALAAAGLAPRAVGEVTLRKENGRPVAGLVVAAGRRSVAEAVDRDS